MSRSYPAIFSILLKKIKFVVLDTADGPEEVFVFNLNDGKIDFHDTFLDADVANS